MRDAPGQPAREQRLTPAASPVGPTPARARRAALAGAPRPPARPRPPTAPTAIMIMLPPTHMIAPACAWSASAEIPSARAGAAVGRVDERRRARFR